MGLLDMLKGALGGGKAAAGNAAGAAKSANPADAIGSMLGGAAGGNPMAGVLGNLMGGSGGNPILKMLLPMVLGGGAAGAMGNLGGLGGLLSKFSGAGQDDKVQSWVGTGPSQPLTGDEVHAALGDDVINQMADESGLPHEEVKSGVASMLPNLVNQLTPGGSVPDAGGLMNAAKGLDLSSILGKLGG